MHEGYCNEVSLGEAYAGIVASVKDADTRGVVTTKDVEAQLERSAGSRFAQTLETIKDAECGLDRASASRDHSISHAVKDAQCHLDARSGDRFAQTVKDIKNVESQLDRSSGDRFHWTIENIKANLVEGLKDGSATRTYIKDSLIENLKDASATRARVNDGFSESFAQVANARREIQLQEESNSRSADALAYKLFGLQEKRACEDQASTMIQFKEQAMLSKELACETQAKLAECCCELKELIRGQASQTRDLVQSQEVDRLRERLNTAETKAIVEAAVKVGK
jgi:hypothetical protein